MNPTLAASDIPGMFYLAPVSGVAALAMAAWFSASVLRKSEGEAEQIRIAAAVREGAMAYLRRQYRVVAMVFVGIVALLLFLSQVLGLQPALSMLGVPIAGFLSGVCGWFGMKMATNASARTATAARHSLNDGLTVAFRSGAVMGLLVVGFALLDVSAWFFILNRFTDWDIKDLTTVMLSFGMGASTQALFARVGGGIFTKAADVGADLVGKVEAGIPEDDARNPATIADNVGDNVGDVAGMGADLYESYYGSILATLALGAAAAFSFPGMPAGSSARLAALLAAAPLALAGSGILCSIAGIFAVRAKEGATFAELLGGLRTGVYVASALIVVASFVIPYTLFSGFGGGTNDPVSWLGVGTAIVAGLVSGLVIARFTEYYTSYEHPPTRRIAVQAHTGPATVIIGGIAEGMKSVWAPILSVVAAILVAFIAAGGESNFLMGLYGVGIAAVGMLSTLGITLATDAYGPIADNAGGNSEMSGQPPEVRRRTDMLDSLGNTTAATGKGFAIGSAALTALALLAAYIQVVQSQLTTQAAAFAASPAVAPFTAPPTLPYAVYQGHGKFVLATPRGEGLAPSFDAGLLMDRRELGDLYPDLAVGAMFFQVKRANDASRTRAGAVGDTVTGEHDASPLDAIWTIHHEQSHGDHTDKVDFKLMPASSAEVRDVLVFYDVTLTNPRVLGGLFIGVLTTFLFCALTMSAVGRAAYSMMRECRRQFGKMREAFRKQGMSEADIADPMRWPKRVEFEGRGYPDYATCVSISTAGAQREMVVPALLAIVIPIAVGLTMSVPGVLGLLAGGLTSGFAVAIFMANAGGAWDNAKKLIESAGRITADQFLDDETARESVPQEIHDAIWAASEEHRRAGRGGAHVYGKGSPDHKATVTGDTVGDPFKDTSGPSLNILIKLIAIVSVVFAGLIVKFGPVVGSWVGLD